MLYVALNETPNIEDCCRVGTVPKLHLHSGVLGFCRCSLFGFLVRSIRVKTVFEVVSGFL